MDYRTLQPQLSKSRKPVLPWVLFALESTVHLGSLTFDDCALSTRVNAATRQFANDISAVVSLHSKSYACARKGKRTTSPRKFSFSAFSLNTQLHIRF